jgi:hypothetical protein
MTENANRPVASRDLISESRDQFVRDTSEHAMEILRDEGIYRHLRFRKPGTVIYGFDLVTWPGYLAIVGDCGDFLFARSTDMFEFFGPNGARGGFEDARWGINPNYWSEKLQAPRPDAARRYCYEQFCERVQEWYADVAKDLTPAAAADLGEALNERVLSPYLDAVHSEHEAHVLLRDFEHDGIRINDSWEWSLRDFDWAFLRCCWAIVYGIGKYRAEGGTRTELRGPLS